ncbi:MAG: Flp family type IVb pilin [Sphingopyxis sp.]
MMSLKNMRCCVRAATAIEYALLIALIAVGGITAFQMTGNKVTGTMNNAAAVLPGDGGDPPNPDDV